MATRPLVQTPGDTPQQPEPSATGATVEELQAALAAQAQQMQQLMGMVANLQANQRAVPSQAAAQALPDITDLDLGEINQGTTPVLTRQGWVVPPSYGADPVALQKERQEAAKTDALVKLAAAAVAKG